MPKLSRGLLCISARGSFLLCREARTVPRHIFHLHMLNSLREPMAVWTGDGSGFLGFLGDVGWLPGNVCACARDTWSLNLFWTCKILLSVPFWAKTIALFSCRVSRWGATKPLSTCWGLHWSKNLTVKEENGKLFRPFHILPVGGRKPRPPDLGLQWWVLNGWVGGALNCQPDGQPSPAYLGRSYGITLQRQIDILLTKQTTPVLSHTQLTPFPFCQHTHAHALSCTGLQILWVVFVDVGLNEVISACVKGSVRSHNN